MNGSVQKLVLVVKGVDSGETLERWVFDCETTKTNDVVDKKSKKSDKDIMHEIQAIMRQITASVTFLPLLSEPCCFDLLVYADQNATVPVSWEDSDPCFIENSEEVRLRSFTTQVSAPLKRILYSSYMKCVLLSSMSVCFEGIGFL